MALTQDDLTSLANNPTRGINMIVNDIEQSWQDGTIQLNSISHPFLYSIDVIVGTSFGFLNRLSDSVSQVYLKHARNVDDLSRNLSDQERYGLLGTPSSTTLQFAIEENTYKSIAPTETLVSGSVTTVYNKLLIPKDTEIEILGYIFEIENGVEIRYNERTGYQVVYDASTNSPFNPITTNLLERDFKIVNGNRYLIVNIPVRQLSCTISENINSTRSAGCSGSLYYTDYLYAVRAFITTNGVSTEMSVSYDQDVFDPLTPTLSLKLDTVNKHISYEIPDVYITNETGIGSVRIYTYTTKGTLTKDLTTVDATQFNVNYLDYRYSNNGLSQYSAQLRTSGGIAWSCIAVTSGGKIPRNFTEMKSGVINDRRQRKIPITDSNMSGMVENYGYSSVKSIDYVTGRQYAVTKELPTQDNKGLYSAMNCFVGSELTSINNLIGSGVTYDNGQRVTVPPNTLFNVTQPTTVLVNSITQSQWLGYTSEQKVELIANNNIVYIPFYYVFDLTNNQAVLRVYHLDEPTINYQNFKEENPSLGFEVGVGSIEMVQQESGYLMTVITESGDNYKSLDNNAVNVQLSFTPEDSAQLASIAATFVGVNEDNERIFQFQIDSRFDVDVNDILYLNNFYQYGSYQDSSGVKLTDELTLLFTTDGDLQYTNTDSDKKIEQGLFNNQQVAIIETHYNVTFGKALQNIYSRIRPLVGEDQYQQYDHDIQATYPTTVYERDDKGQLVVEDGALVVVHKAGDLMYNGNGQPIYAYRKGDYVKDKDGNYVMLAPRDLQYHWDFMAFDGSYYFSDDDYDKQFAQETKDYFVNTITGDMESFTTSSLDRTSLVYQPKNKIGYQNVIINSNIETSIRRDMSFTVTYYLTKTGYKNQNLKDSLTLTTPQVINNVLYNTNTVGMSDIIDELRANVSDEVVDIKVSSIAGENSIDVISNLDDLSGFSVRKVLEVDSDDLLSVEEDIDIIFLKHDVSAID